MHLDLERLMCEAIVWAAAALRKLGWLADPPSPFNSGAERFSQRFGCFEVLLRPAPLVYEQYAEECAEVRGVGGGCFVG